MAVSGMGDDRWILRPVQTELATIAALALDRAGIVFAFGRLWRHGAWEIMNSAPRLRHRFSRPGKPWLGTLAGERHGWGIDSNQLQRRRGLDAGMEPTYGSGRLIHWLPVVEAVLD